MKKRLAVTQKQIADRAGVSQTVVSLVLRDSYDVALSDETRRRVLDIASELGYVPQAAAKSLIEGHSTNIALVLIQPHYQVFRDPYIPNIITGLSGVVRNHGYRLLAEHIDNTNQLNTISNMLKGGEVAGMILSTCSGVEHIVNPLVEAGYPIVMLEAPTEKYYTVMLDHQAGIKSAIQHLVDLGHQKVACIAYGPANSHINKRLHTFKQTLADNGITADNNLIRHGHYDPETGYAAMKELLDVEPRPTAVFGMNDMMALGAMRAILEAGLRIPEDIAVVGYDDMRFAEFINPPLTTVRSPEIGQGRDAGKMLIKLIDNTPIDKRLESLTPHLLIRQSCGGKKIS